MKGQTESNFLAIDTASAVFSVALESKDGLWYFEADAGALHSQLLMEVIDLLCKKASLEPGDLSAVLCMRGPGSFTGLRIGFSSAKGLALALGIPFAALSTLDCMARPFAMWPGLVMPVIDAKKSSYFYALYCNGARVTPDFDADLNSIEKQITLVREKHGGDAQKVLLTGPDAQKLYEEWENTGVDISRAELALAPSYRGGCAKELLSTVEKTDIFNKPHDFSGGLCYIRKSDAELNLEKQQENVR